MSKKYMKICKECNNEFKELRKEQLYCSRDCWLASHKAVYVSRICKHCNIEFQIREKRVLNNKGVYCSKECYSKDMYKLYKKSKKDINRDYRNTHKELTTIWKHKRRALKSDFGGFFTKEEWITVKKSFNNCCAICKKSEPFIKLSVDHIIPITKWKEWSNENKITYKWNDIQNIQPLCISCNSRKRDNIK